MPWVICRCEGVVLAAHCNCVAGLGESCSHVASLLWAIEAGVRLRNSMTVTQKKAYWVMPTGVKDVPYSPIKDISFRGKTSLRASWNEFGNKSGTSEQQIPEQSLATSKKIEPPSQNELCELYSALSKCKSKPAILSLVKEHASDYIPKSLNPQFPQPLSTLYDPSKLDASYTELLSAADAVVATGGNRGAICNCRTSDKRAIQFIFVVSNESWESFSISI